MIQSYKIPEQNVAALEEAIAKLNKIAKKLGLSAITMTLVREVLEPVRDSGNVVYKKFMVYSIEGETPKFSDWSFVASVEPTEFGNVIRKVPNADIEGHWQTDKMICQHCNKQRSRKAYYIVKHDDGVEKSVGASCIKDFLGHKNPQQIASWLQIVFEISSFEEDREDLGSSHSEPKYYIDLQSAIEVALSCIRIDGYLSKTKARELEVYRQSTADNMHYYFQKPFQFNDHKEWNEFRELHQPGDYEKELAPAIMQWMKDQENKVDRTEFFMNLCIFAKQGAVSFRDLGYISAAAMIAGREFDRLKTADLQKKKSNEWVGEEGKRVEFESLALVTTRELSDKWGVKYLYIFEDKAGNSVKWFSSKDVGLKENATYKVTGTVKRHDEYKDRKQTLITRCKCEALQVS